MKPSSLKIGCLLPLLRHAACLNQIATTSPHCILNSVYTDPPYPTNTNHALFRYSHKMSPPSEITESADDLDLKTLSLAKIKTKPDESAVATAGNTTKSPDSTRNHLPSRPLGPSRLGAVELAHKSAMKRPFRLPLGGASSSSSNSMAPGTGGGGGGALDTASLKQALRRLSIVQASEMAAMKRLSKPSGVSSGSEAGTIQRLYASVVAQDGESQGGGGGGNPITPDEEGDKIAATKSCAKPGVQASNKSSPTKPSSAANNNNKRTVSPRLTKPRVRDIIASTSPRTEKEPSPRARTTMTKQQKPKPTSDSPASVSISNSCADSNIPGISPRLARPPLQTKTTPKKPISTTSSMPKEPNKSHETNKAIPPTPPKKPPILQRRKESAAAAAAISKPVEQKSYPLPRPATAPATSNPHDARTIVLKRIEFPRHLEKGDSSQSSKSSMGDYSSSTTSISGDSNQSGGSSVVGTRPHMSNDARWASIRGVEMRNGGIGLMNFKLLKRLGCGDIGTVYLAELCGSGCLFALKVMDNEFLARRKKMMRALTEREILQMLDHPFLPTLYTYFTTDNLSCLVMEYCPGGDLHVLRQKQHGRHFSEPSARFYVAEVLLALEYLHMLGVVYRDLKPENILVREDGHIMLSDFDLSLRCSVNPFLVRASSVSAADCARPSGACSGSGCIDPLCLHSSWAHSSCFTPRLLTSATTPRTRKLKPDQTTHGSRSLPQLVVEPIEARSNSFVGTHEYLAPEIIKGEGHGSSVDWWTFGIFLYELLYGKTPFKGSGNEETLANVISQNLRFPDSPAVSFRARDLIRGLLVKEPENRLGSRRGAAEIKRHPFFEGLNWALIRCATPPEMPKPCDYGSIVAEVLSKKEEKALELKENGDKVEFELF